MHYEQDDEPRFELVADRSLMVHWRDEQHRTWASIAQEIGLSTAGAAERLYGALVNGEPI